jgi:hypothetical protein
MRPAGWLGSAWGVTLLYAAAAVFLTWPLLPRAARDVPGDLLDPLFTCWALGWNFHAFGLTDGPRPGSYWDANIFHPSPMALARSEHFLAQALQGAPVYALTGQLVLTYNVLFLATFVLSGTFLYLLAREYTADRFAAAAAGLLYAFALFRWVQVAHLGGLSSQWMPLALLLCGHVARAKGVGAATGAIAALGAVTAVQAISSGRWPATVVAPGRRRRHRGRARAAHGASLRRAAEGRRGARPGQRGRPLGRPALAGDRAGPQRRVGSRARRLPAG